MRRDRSWLDPGSPSESSSSAMSGTSSPNYMKATTSWVARKASSSSLTTPERRKSPASRGKSGSKLSNVSVEQSSDPQVAPSQGISVDRATCSSVLKSSKFPDHIQLNSGGLESEGTSSFHVCPYNYCSLHSHHHHDPSLSLKEFIFVSCFQRCFRC